MFFKNLNINQSFYQFFKFFFITLSLHNFYANLNLPVNQIHNYHLFDEQEVYYKKAKYAHNFSNGYSVIIPLLLSFSLFCFCFFFVNYLWGDDLYHEILTTPHSCGAKDSIFGWRNFLVYMIISIWLIFLWFEHIKFESKEGYHNFKVNADYKMGFILFLLSEIMFFFSIFWAFFHFSLSPNIEFGYIWPPMGIDVISFLNLPLLNTVILITSGLFVTWSHNALRREKYHQAVVGLAWTITLGIIFLFCQLVEYSLSGFSINDGAMGSIFFFGTGFHGLHVLLGTVALIYNLFKLVNKELCGHSHYSYLFAIWYWHFVDIIWLFLYLIFYIWGQVC